MIYIEVVYLAVKFVITNAQNPPVSFSGPQSYETHACTPVKRLRSTIAYCIHEMLFPFCIDTLVHMKKVKWKVMRAVRCIPAA